MAEEVFDLQNIFDLWQGKIFAPFINCVNVTVDLLNPTLYEFFMYSFTMFSDASFSI